MASLPLSGWQLAPVPADAAATYAGDLLRALGAGASGSGSVLSVSAATGSGPARDWAASGLMSLTGRADGPPRSAPGCPATAARAAVLALEALAGPIGVSGHQLLGERAALRGLTRRAPWSAGGSCRALRASDGWVAVSLARPEDLAAIPAVVGGVAVEDPWAALDLWGATRTAEQVAERCQLLGVPAAAVPARPARVWPPWRIISREGPTSGARPLVLDLSSLWAGPLCGSLLELAGAEVIRVESTERPDGGRQVPDFDDLLHPGQQSVALPFREERGIAALKDLLRQADVVLTSARSRALAQLGLLEALGQARVWVALSAYPQRADGGEWVGFGDDTAMAAGLVCREADGVPVPCGDAMADPLTGMHAALAAQAALQAGGRHVIRLNLHDVAASTLADVEPGIPGPVRAPVARPRGVRARPLGADTLQVVAAFS